MPGNSESLVVFVFVFPYKGSFSVVWVYGYVLDAFPKGLFLVPNICKVLQILDFRALPVVTLNCIFLSSVHISDC